MFAILGLVGLALSTVMITGPDWSEQDTVTDSTGSMPSWVKRHQGFQSRPQTMRRFFPAAQMILWRPAPATILSMPKVVTIRYFQALVMMRSTVVVAMMFCWRTLVTT